MASGGNFVAWFLAPRTALLSLGGCFPLPEHWLSCDLAVTEPWSPWLSCDLAVTELWPSLAVTKPWSLGPEPWPPWSPWAHGDHLFSHGALLSWECPWEHNEDRHTKIQLNLTRLYDNHGSYQLLKAFVKQQCLFLRCVEQSLRVGEDEIEFPNLHIFNWMLLTISYINSTILGETASWYIMLSKTSELVWLDQVERTYHQYTSCV